MVLRTLQLTIELAARCGDPLLKQRGLFSIRPRVKAPRGCLVFAVGVGSVIEEGE